MDDSRPNFEQGQHQFDSDAIAIIGMAGRFPGASCVDELWQNLLDGVDSLEEIPHEELLAEGVDPDLINHPDYVRAVGRLPDIDLFDGSLFGYSPSEAIQIDPQQRLLLECAFEALENAGYGGTEDACDRRTGVFAGTGFSEYGARLFAGQMRNPGISGLDTRSTMYGCDKDFVATRIAYKLGLRGPAVAVQTACSTSLVAVCLACESLLGFHADIALAGGSSIRVPQNRGYLYQPGGLLARDGRCRAFDASTTGTSIGSGLGMVVLKRLEDAIADNDHIEAVIRGYGINNDGKSKAGFSAPSVEGQIEVIRRALEMAGYGASDVDFIETHGTGTVLGDAVELSALASVFKGRAEDPSAPKCLLGSIKTNIGHLDAASGIVGLIKATLAVRHGIVPPMLHFKQPHRLLDLERTPFSVNTSPVSWGAEDRIRRAGVSSFGIGGTNAHILVEQFCTPTPSNQDRDDRPQALLFSGRSTEAVRQVVERVDAVLEGGTARLTDVAFTLQTGRGHFEHRIAYVRHRETALDTTRPPIVGKASMQRGVVFMFPGFGVECGPSAIEFFRREPVFRETVLHCAEVAGGLGLQGTVQALWSEDVGAPDLLLAPHPGMIAQFAWSLGLARVLNAAGIEPEALLGHSLGEYVAAHLAGVISLEDALRLVDTRATLFTNLVPGEMLSVSLAESAVSPYLGGDISLAAVNAPNACVLSGSPAAIASVTTLLQNKGVDVRRLKTSVAAHSHLLDPILEQFAREVSKIRLSPPSLPLVSCRTGTWMTAEEATDPAVWVDQLRGTVRFSRAVETLLSLNRPVLLEIGPSRVLCSLAQQGKGRDRNQIILGCGRHKHNADNALTTLQTTFAELWANGVAVDWRARHDALPNRVALPSAPFQRQSYWADLPHGPTRPQDPGDHGMTHIGFDAAAKAQPERGETQPFTGVSGTVMAAFRQTLGYREIGPDENFFQLGGDSLMALRLCSLLTRLTGRQVPVEILIACPTIRLLAERLKDPGPIAQDPHLVILKPGQPAGTLYCVHPAGGNVLCYRDLAQKLGADHAVIGLKAMGLEQGEQPLSDVSEMAEYYFRSILRRQSEGPFYLIGLSFGGVVAFELARRLRESDHDVAFVGLLDSPAPGHLPKDIEDRAECLIYLAGYDSGLSTAQLVGLNAEAQLERALQYGRLAELFPQIEGGHGAVRQAAERYVRVFNQNLIALRTYTPRPYDGRVHFYRARIRYGPQPLEPEQPWLPLVRGGLCLHVVPGAHETMIDAPHVDDFAPLLKDHLIRSGWSHEP